MEIWCYTRVTHSRSAYASFICSRRFCCADGQIVFGWVLKTSRVLGPHSGTFFQLTWKLQIKLSTYLKNCLTHIWSEKLTTLLPPISTIRSILYILILIPIWTTLQYNLRNGFSIRKRYWSDFYITLHTIKNYSNFTLKIYAICSILLAWNFCNLCSACVVWLIVSPPMQKKNLRD